METLESWDGASFDPRDLIGRIYVGVNKTLQHTKYISCGPHVMISKETFQVFPHISLFKLLITRAWPIWSQGLDWQDSCRRPLDIDKC